MASSTTTQEERINPFELFPPNVRDRVVGLTYLGYLTRTVEFCGHRFVLKTLRPGEKAAVALAIEPWKETLAQPEMWAAAHVGMSLTSVDEVDEFCPPAGPDIDAFARARLRYVIDPESGWFNPTVNYLFENYVSLEDEASEALREFQNLELRSQQPLQDSADSSTDQDTSIDATGMDGLPSESFS